ncbi:MAG: Outer membrane protein (OmpH-like) [Chlorobi bacterium OLB6]|nr:MAG: Outer membrane protein (OmpH-like) [Chlorobi bacterium OLB6]
MHPNSHNTTAIYALVGFLLCAVSAFSQKIGYVSSDAIKSKYEPYLMAEQRLNQMVQDWKSELAQYQADIDGAELEIRKNRLIWTDVEKEQYQRELDQKKKETR